ncbi:TPA: hypothetical protein ACGE8L_004713 [Yersinia enterocolitica]|nr:hypothetical protein [Yersinia enterocolitica]HEK7317264.1 hypothetical protein [Yersinia enterocolitica]HEN3294871.1 hypothetical protein [Yersinia enterocolitica]
MSLKGYDQLRMYKQCLIYMTVQWEVSLDETYLEQLYAPEEYQKYIYFLLEKTFPNAQLRKAKKKELEQSLTCLILDGSYFSWLKDSERAACFAWFYIRKERTIFPSQVNINTHFKGTSYSTDNKSHPVPAIFIGKVGPFNMDSLKYIHSGGNDVNDVNDANRHSDYILAVMKHVDDLCLPLSEKIIYLGNMKRAWVNQYNTFMEPFSWLDEQHESACVWAWEYMRKNNFVDNNTQPLQTQLKSFVVAAFDNFSDEKIEQAWLHKQQEKKDNRAEETKQSNQTITDEVKYDHPYNDKELASLCYSPELMVRNALNRYKTAFLKSMKNAWSQKKYKENNQGKARKETASAPFELELITMMKLKSLASAYNMNEKRMITKLIDESNELLKKNIKTIH